MEFLEPALDNYVHYLFKKNRNRLKFSELVGQETLLGAALLARLGKAKEA